MPGLGGISCATNILASAVTLNVSRNEALLRVSSSWLESGLRARAPANDTPASALATRPQAQPEEQPDAPRLGCVPDALGPIDHALDEVLGKRALLGASVVRLDENLTGDHVASVNLTAAASMVRDLNVLAHGRKRAATDGSDIQGTTTTIRH